MNVKTKQRKKSQANGMHRCTRDLISLPIKLFLHCRIKSIIKVTVFKGVLIIILHIWSLARSSRNITNTHIAWNRTGSFPLNSTDKNVRNRSTLHNYTARNNVRDITLFTGSRSAFGGFLASFLLLFFFLLLPPFPPPEPVKWRAV